MQNPHENIGKALDEFMNFALANGNKNANYLVGVVNQLTEQLSTLSQCFIEGLDPEITRIMYKLLDDEDLNDAELEQAAKALLIEPDLSDRQGMIDQLSAYF